MDSPWDPIRRAADGTQDLYDVATWEERTRLDRLSALLYRGLVRGTRVLVVLLAVLILLAQLTLTGLATVDNPVLGVYILLSVVPALLLAGYVWKADVTRGEPLGLLVATFLLGFLFAGFAAVLNTLLEESFAAVPAVGMLLFFYLVVGPVEETVKLLAVRLHAYRSDRFDAVVDGAVYGAVAGLGFATIENTLYITQQSVTAAGMASGDLVGVTAARTFAGPGHIIYSAFAGYYLGLAKFNPEHRGPIVVKGLLIAVFIHATYNSIVSHLGAIQSVTPGLSELAPGVVFIGFVVAYDGVFGYLLYRKLARYRATYRDLDASRADPDDASRADEPDGSAVADAALAGSDERDPGGRSDAGGVDDRARTRDGYE
jgi:RsiW-degrading membrane proteinase PrsW (M82 family)